jgi:spore coat polysaccharide biosynthesis predicted glycosyltransferase SpsG
MGDSDIVVIANAGPDVGLGHLVRCLALTAAIESRGCQVDLWIPEHAEAEEFAKGEGIEPRMVPRKGEPLTRMVEKASPGVVVVDSYDIDEDTIASLSNESSIAVLDELGDRCLPVDLVVNNNAYADDIEYPSAGQVLRGPEYCMLRESFRKVPQPEPVEATTVLVTIGGADLQNSFGDLIRTVAESVPNRVSLVAVVGPYFEVPDDIRELATFYVTPDSMPQLMSSADFAVSGGGQTMYELAACGTPPASVCLAADQVRNIDALSDRDFCIPVGSPTERGFEENLAEAVEKLATDDELRVRMARIGRRLVDGHGADRVGLEVARVGKPESSRS